MTPSPKSIDMIEGFEIGQPYNPRIIWPGGASGPTGGVGYDFAYESPAQIKADWGDLLPPGIVTRLQSYAGRYGAQAQHVVQAAADIVIPRAAADVVFRERNIPRYADLTATAFRCSALSGDSFGALVSLVFNRGPGMSDTPNFPGSRLEMRQIRDALAAGEPEMVPGYIRNMKRLWIGKGLDGLLVRRDAEAALFEAGLGIVPAPEPHQMTADELMDAEISTFKGTTP